MYGWLIYDRKGVERNRGYVEHHFELSKRYGIKLELKLADELSLEDEIPDFAFVRTIDPELSRRLEESGVRVFNPYKVSYIANHKGRCIEYIRDNTDVPVIPTFKLENVNCEFSEVDRDFVIKSVSGHGGEQVWKINRCSNLKDVVKRLSKEFSYDSKFDEDSFIIQPYIDGPREDVRVYVVGNEIVAAVKRRAVGDEFRANASLGGEVSTYELSSEERDYVEQIVRLFDFGMVGIDFIICADGRFIFNEIEDVVGARMLYRVRPDIDILNMYFKHICSISKCRDDKEFYEEHNK